MEAWAGVREKLMNNSFTQTPFALSDWCEVVLEYVRPHTCPLVPSVLAKKVTSRASLQLVAGHATCPFLCDYLSFRSQS